MNIPRYITQLTKDWIKSVSKKLVQGSYIRIDETDDTRTVSVDVEGLRDFLGSGTVISVDGHEPDENGAVSFGLTGSKWVKTDGSGHLTTTDETPATVPSTAGYVKSDGENFSTVDDIPVSDVDFTGATNVIPVAAVNFGSGVTNVTSNNIGNYAATVTALSTLAATHNTDFENLAAVINNHSQLIAGKANTDHSHQPSDITGLNASTILRKSDINADGGVAATSHQHQTSDITGLSNAITTEVTSAVDTAMDGYATQAELDDVVDTVNVIDASLFDASDNKLFVDTTSDQTVGGKKTFSSPICMSGVGHIRNSANNSYVLLCGSNDYSTGGHIVLGSNLGTTNGNGIISLRTNKDNYAATLTITPGSGRNLCYYERNQGTTYDRFRISENFDFFSRNNAATTGRWLWVNLKTHDNVVTGQFIGGVNDYGNHEAYVRAVKGNVNSSIRVTSTGTSGTCSQTLENPPSADSDATDDKQIAWRGWVNNKFCKKNGTVTIADEQTITGAKTFSGIVTANGNFTANSSVFLASNIHGTAGRTSSLHICSGQNWDYGAHVVLSKAGNFSVVSEKMGIGGVMTSAYSLYGSNEGKLTWSGTTTDSTSTEDNQLPKLGYINDKFVRKSFSEAASEDKVLMLKEGSQTASWVASSLTPTDPTSPTVFGGTAADNNVGSGTWVYNTTSPKGVQMWVTSRVRWNGTTLLEYRRLLTFSENGLLYSIGQEETHQIETPTEIRWS